MFNLSYANFSNTYRHHARQDRDTLLASLGWQAGQGAAEHRNGALCVSLALLGAGVPLVDAVVLANRAAGIVVGKLGTATVDYDELFH